MKKTYHKSARTQYPQFLGALHAAAEISTQRQVIQFWELRRVSTCDLKASVVLAALDFSPALLLAFLVLGVAEISNVAANRAFCAVNRGFEGMGWQSATAQNAKSYPVFRTPRRVFLQVGR